MSISSLKIQILDIKKRLDELEPSELEPSENDYADLSHAAIIMTTRIKLAKKLILIEEELHHKLTCICAHCPADRDQPCVDFINYISTNITPCMCFNCSKDDAPPCPHFMNYIASWKPTRSKLDSLIENVQEKLCKEKNLEAFKQYNRWLAFYEYTKRA